jgi:hypothetical protein
LPLLAGQPVCAGVNFEVDILDLLIEIASASNESMRLKLNDRIWSILAQHRAVQTSAENMQCADYCANGKEFDKYSSLIESKVVWYSRLASQKA